MYTEKSRQAVHDRWLKLVAAARRGPVAPSVPSLRQYLDRWLRETVRPNLAPSTVANYEFFSDAYINPSLGSKRLDRLTVRDVQLWMNDLRERCQCCAQGKMRPGADRGVAPLESVVDRLPLSGPGIRHGQFCKVR